MILVDIEVPSLDSIYNFNLDENAAISSIIEEVVSVIAQMWQQENIQAGGFLLSEPSKGSILDPDASLAEYGIAAGAKLLLV
ncbi:MAG: glutamyl-tRNA amidotransferase [Eubacteriales bacterium]|nr:glutamyl-tRNA amidotransferase [Eubacteriales bacterium]